MLLGVARSRLALVGRPHCRVNAGIGSQLQAHFSALMPYRVAADLLKQVFPIDAGKEPETVRRHTLKIGAALRIDAVTSGQKWRRRPLR